MEFPHAAMNNTDQLEIQRKRHFFTFVALIVIVTFIILVGIDYMEGELLENGINLAVILALAAGLAAIRRPGADVVVYRAIHFIICLLLLYSVAIGTGKGTVLYWVYMLPLLLFYFFGKWEGAVWAVGLIVGLGAIMIFPSIFGAYNYGNVVVSRFFITLPLVMVMGFGLESSRHTFSRLLAEKNVALRREKEQVELALAEIKTLSGLIPICSNCKKVRNDSGYWEQVETYIQDHSQALFSHSVCPECCKKLYPDYTHLLEKKGPG